MYNRNSAQLHLIIRSTTHRDISPPFSQKRKKKQPHITLLCDRIIHPRRRSISSARNRWRSANLSDFSSAKLKAAITVYSTLMQGQNVIRRAIMAIQAR